MEGFGKATPFASLVAQALGDAWVTLVDVGCSSGIDNAWRAFGDRLKAFAFDPNVDEIARLAQQERLAGITYVPAFVGVTRAPGEATVMPEPVWARNPWSRLSIARTLELQAAAARFYTAADQTERNLWQETTLASAATPIDLTAFLDERNVDDVDFVKIDVDGGDFQILRSAAAMLEDRGVLGVGIEVNFFGSDDPDVNTFHNVDRFLKARGFELFALSTRSYSTAALPAPYLITIPAQTAWGRVLQGDAIYFRDAATEENHAWAHGQKPVKLLKLAALFSLAGLADCAAEILTRFRDRLEGQIDVDAGLDALLVQTTSQNGAASRSYSLHMREFEHDAPHFYPPGRPSSSTAPTLERALAALGRRTAPEAYEAYPIATAEVPIAGNFFARKRTWPLALRTKHKPRTVAMRLRIPEHAALGSARYGIIRVATSDVDGDLWLSAIGHDKKAVINRCRLEAGPARAETILVDVDLDAVWRILIHNGKERRAGRATVHHAGVLLLR